MEKFYLDACIWRDYFENRSDRFRPLGEWALRLIKKIKDERGLFVISDHLLRELKMKDVTELMNIISYKSIIIIRCNHIQFKEAKRLSKIFNIPRGDALHAILARDNDALLITRDKHFYELQDYVEINKPEDLI